MVGSLGGDGVFSEASLVSMCSGWGVYGGCGGSSDHSHAADGCGAVGVDESVMGEGGT